jgi:phage tail-like protein
MARQDPISVYKFAIEIQGVISGWFSECSGLSMSRDVFPQKEGGVNDFIHQLPGRNKYNNITFKRGVADDEFWDWYQKGLYDGKVEYQNISIMLFNDDRSKIKRWDLERAYPIKWTGPDFKSDSNQVAIESMEIVHHGMTLTKWTDA